MKGQKEVPVQDRNKILVGGNGAVMLISAFKSRKSISGTMPHTGWVNFRTYKSLFAALPDSVIFT